MCRALGDVPSRSSVVERSFERSWKRGARDPPASALAPFINDRYPSGQGRSDSTVHRLDVTDESTDAAHLERSRAVWDRRSDSYDRDERELASQRETAIDHLDLEAGDRVLEVGCGPGTNFERIVCEIGDTGSLLAVDYSPEMVERARERVADGGWDTVEVREADATTAEVGDGFDAALAVLAMGVMPDKRRAVENVYDSLRDGGTFVVFDVRPVPAGPGRILNPLLRRYFRWYANWNPDGDVEAAVADVFDESEVVETYVGGVGYTVLARKRTA